MNRFDMKKELDEAGVKFSKVTDRSGTDKHVARLDGVEIDSDRRLGELVQRLHDKFGG